MTLSFTRGQWVLAGVALWVVGGAGCSAPPRNLLRDDGGPGGPRCGNGVQEAGEECDDGNDDNTDGCCNSCTHCPICAVAQGGECTVGVTVCCNNEQDRPTSCVQTPGADPGVGRCLVPCTTYSDCYYNEACGLTYEDHCYANFCGPDDSGTPVNRPCLAANDASGFCYPQGRAESDYGFCMEAGSLAAGEICAAGFSLTGQPRDTPLCADGLCLDWISGRPAICTPFCDPVAAFHAPPGAGDGCPAGTNCVNLASLSSSSGFRLADRGLCLPGAEDPEGTVACDLITGELIKDRAQRCPDVRPGSKCAWFRTGSLYGTCKAVDATPLGLGGDCKGRVEDADGNALLRCAEGLRCSAPDPFGVGGDERVCLQICDASDETWACADATSICTSLSHGLDEDSQPTPLGLCAPPPPPPEE